MEVVEVADLYALEGSPHLLGDHLDGLKRPNVEEFELEVVEVRGVLHAVPTSGSWYLATR